MTSGQARSRHFGISEVSPGVWAAVAADGGWAVGNAGVIDLGDQTLVFDTFASVEAAMDLRKFVATTLGREVEWVVNSHCHRDHVRGNQVFELARIATSAKTQEILARVWQARSEQVQREGIGRMRSEVEAEFRSMRERAPETPEDKLLWDGYQEAIVQGLAGYHLKLPDVTFTSSKTFAGEKRAAEAITFGGGHSASDVILYLPEERTAFLGDLLFAEYLPYLGDGNPNELLRALDKVESLDPTMVVPGHGPPSKPDALQRMREYVEAVRTQATELKSSGREVKDPTAFVPPPPFDRWRWRVFHMENLDALTRQSA